MSGSPGNTNSGGARSRSPRNTNADVTARDEHEATDRHPGEGTTESAGGIGVQESTAKQQPDDANAEARKKPTG